jgi:cytosine/adenosine deaminase-related metal-dependent hydrolase
MMQKIAAGTIYPVTSSPVQNGVLILDDQHKVLDIVSREEVSGDVQYFEGAICPGFINAHCHLELSHLEGAVPEGTGIVDFVLNLQKIRHFPEEEMLEAAIKADQDMYEKGIVAVGDISNGSSSFPVKERSNIYYHTFIELIGFNPAFAPTIIEKGRELQALAGALKSSLTAHAPYSVSEALFRALASEEEILSVHNQESMAENHFFLDKSGNFNRLYETFGLDISFYHPSGKTSLQTYIDYLNPAAKHLFVHNTFTSEPELAMIRERIPQAWWCLCPQANLYIERSLPPVAEMLRQQCQITLGTDSLASNHTLDILSEIRTIQTHFPEISFEEILRWATINGARFLGIEHQFGSLEKGKKPGIVQILPEGKARRIA